MKRTYRVKIGDIYLTKDGSLNALPCFLQIINLSKLRELYKKTSVESVDGTQVTQTFATKDVPFAVNVALLPRAVGDLLVDLYNDTAASGELISFEANDGGNVNLSFDVEFISFDYKDSQSDVWEDSFIQLVKK